MKTTEISHEMRVMLKDGATHLATWSQSFDSTPTIGDKISFPDHVGNLEQLDSFRSRGRVTKIQRGTTARDSYIEIEAEPRSGFRRSLTLNSGFIPKSLRMDAERRVRQTMPDIRVVWEESMDPHAILRMADTSLLPAGTLEDAHRSRGEMLSEEKKFASVRITLQAQLKQMLTRSREVLAHF